jgi:putative restriction endonuclease
MRYWWVNQNQTYTHEVRGGYLWSPKLKSDQTRNPFYDFMREVAPGDVVFSFAKASICALGRVTSHAYEAPKPLEFGVAGAYWDLVGWRVDVAFTELRVPLRPAEFMDALGPLLPKRYSPLRANGAGLQNVYLTVLPQELAGALVDLLGIEGRMLASPFSMPEHLQPVSPGLGLLEWEQHELDKVQADGTLADTERKAVILARRGQGVFKQRVMQIESSCRITGVSHVEHLRASHCKPWRDSSYAERLDGENGLLLTPNADHLFDRGFIGFEDSGDVLISPVAHAGSLARLGLTTEQTTNVGRFSEGQRKYLEFHREHVLLRSRFLES